MGLFDAFKKGKHKENYANLEDSDIFRPKECIAGTHEFIAYVFHEDQCIPTMPQIHYVCQKCNVRYYGDTPLKYGVVIEENKRSDSNKHFCENCGKETEFINPLFCSVCGYKRNFDK